jgi:GMP synthase (glutamine-hydrolysing)
MSRAKTSGTKNAYPRSRANRFLVFQHSPWEEPGPFLVRSAMKHRIRLDIVELWRQPIPDISPYYGLIVLGGSMNVDQEGQYPFLKAEKETIHRVIEKDMPYLGFCLGHQLLAEALGCSVRPNHCISVGLIQGKVTHQGRAHALFRGIPTTFILFKWHSQAVTPPLPKQVNPLVTSKDCQIEAISVEGRPHLIGLQFDNHAAAFLNVREWIHSDFEWLERASHLNASVLLSALQRLEGILGRQFELMFSNYLELTL